MSNILPLFWHLSSASRDERINASAKLVGSLTQFQEQFKERIQTNGDEESSDEGSKDELERYNAPDVSYTIRRLIRGLASPRESSRLGFAVVLTELLNRLDTLSVDRVMEMMINASQIKGSMSGQEQRDMYFARLFGMTSLIQSGLLFRASFLSYKPEQSISSHECFEEVIQELVTLSEKKSWLRESCWWSIGLAMEKLRSSSIPWKENAAKQTLSKLFDGSWTPEKVAIALKLQPQYPNVDWSTILSKRFKGSEILSPKNLGILVTILKDEETIEEGESASSSNSAWNPQLHFIWTVIFDCYYPSTERASIVSAPTMAFQDFFRQVVDEVFFANNSSAARKYRGFQIFRQALSKVPEDEVATLFTPNLLRCWINNLSVRDRYLHRMTLQLAKDTQKLVEEKPNTAFPIVMALMDKNGSQQFDRLTKSNTISSILTSMNEESIQKYRDYLLSQFMERDGGESVENLNYRRAWAVEQLGSLIRNGAIPKSENLIQSILEFFVLHGLFIVKKKTDKGPLKVGSPLKPPLSDDLRDLCVARLFACLSDLATLVSRTPSSEDKNIPRNDMGHRWISRVIKLIGSLLSDTKHFTALVDLDEEESAAVASAIKLMDEVLLKAPESRQSVAKGAELLLASSILQVFAKEDREAKWDSLQECVDATKELISTFTISKMATKALTKTEADDSSPPVDILVDIIIGYMERGTAYFRTIGTKSFNFLSAELEESTLDLILAQLEKRTQEEEEEEAESDENVEMEGGSQGSNSSESSENESEEDEEVNEAENVKLRKKIEQVLRMNGIKRADESGSEDGSEEEELLDDDQMMQFDEKLAEVFRLRRNEKMGKDDAQREASHFKNRVVDLLEAFVRHHPTSPYLINLPLPVVRAIVECGKDEKQYSDKLTGLLRSKLAKTKEFPKEVDIARSKNDLQILHELGRKIHSQDHLATINACCLYLSRILVHEGLAAEAAEIYQVSLKDFAIRKASQLNPSFFKEVCKRLPELTWKIRYDFISSIDLAINAYRKTHVFDLVATFILQPYTCKHLDELEKMASALSPRLCSLVNAACQGEDSKTLNAQQLKEITKAGQSIARFCRKHLPTDTLVKCWDLPKLEETQQRLSDSERFNKSGVLAAWKTLLAIFSPNKQSSNKSLRKGSNAGINLAGSLSEGPVEPKTGKKRKNKSQVDVGGEIVSGEGDQLVGNPKRKKIKHKKTSGGS